MIVYVLLGGIDYEGTFLIGVYKTKEGAEKEQSEQEKRFYYESFSIEECELEE